ncbi:MULTISPECIES: hypothetical protein [unclassified Bacteroides]|uniref:hypothetical protein n=1 Tax=unclassified Bacteroides TaxID=2646097 RepID=UPI000E88A104|nr:MULTISPECIES: hypothetical protein [unclassified Bacteroides]RGN59216.1 hypothetical protein DXB58_13820 [Bacteroides sp. OM05-10AA]RGQ65057.1 hypothetical protein DWY87_15290 [Bacteroides sp. AF27-33]
MAKYVIDYRLLKEGDIILINENERLAKMMRSKFDHVMYFAGGITCIEADGLAVKANQCDRFIFADPQKCMILRLRDNQVLDKISMITTWIRSRSGMEYSTEEARLVQTARNGKHKQDRTFCTRLVTQAFHLHGIDLVENPDYCTPQEIVESKKLMRVSDYLFEVSEDTNIQSSPVLESQRDILLMFHQEVSKIFNCDIQTEDDIIRALIKQPSLDNMLVNSVKESGFDTLIQQALSEDDSLLNKSTFLYRFAKDVQFSILNERIYFSTLKINDLKTQIVNYQDLYSCHKLDYFKYWVDIYSQILEITNNMQQMAFELLFSIASYDKKG